MKTDVITREEAERRGATNVAEALQSQPGVQVNPSAYGFLGGVSAIQVQGFDRDRVLVLEDGERVIGDTGGAIDLSNLSLADVSRVEVVTGPTSSLYGSSAIGGVVNVITAPPRFEGPSGNARVEGRSVPGFVAIGSGAYRKGRAWIGLDASYTFTDAVARLRDKPDTLIPNIERSFAGARGGFALSERVDVRLRARWFHQNSIGLRTEDKPNLPRFFVDQPEDTNRYTLHAILNADLGRGSSLRLTLGRQWYENQTADDRRDSPVDQIHDRHQRMQSAEATLTLADGPRTWVAGTRFEAESFRQEVTNSTVAMGSLTRVKSDELVPLTIVNAAGYAQLGWVIGPLTVMPGLRAEYNDRFEQLAVAPRLAAALKLERLIARVSFGRGYRAPSGKELGFVFDHSFLGYRVLGNAALQPESSWGGNGDVTFTASESISLRAGAYANYIENLIDIDTRNFTQVGSVMTYAYKNYGRARTMGLEARAIAKLGERFRAEVGWDHLYTRDDESDAPLPSRPQNTITCALQWRLPWKLELYSRFRAVTSSFVTEDLRAPGFSTVDVRLSREIWPRATAYIGALDAFDVRQDPARAGDFRPPLGRVLYAGVRAEAPWDQQ